MMKDVYAGHVTKFHSLSLRTYWLTSSSTKCVNRRSWFYFRLMICSVFLSQWKQNQLTGALLLPLTQKSPCWSSWARLASSSASEVIKLRALWLKNLKSLSTCIAQPGINLLPPLLILEIMRTYAFRGKKKRAVTHCCVTPICMLEERCWYKWCYRGQKRAYTSGESVLGYTVKMHQGLRASPCPDLNPGLVLLILQKEEIKTESDSTALPTFCLLCFLNHVGNGLMWTVLQCFRYSLWSVLGHVKELKAWVFVTAFD